MASQLIAIAIGGAAGALARYGIAAATAAIQIRASGNTLSLFPWGTLIANLLGAFLMGLLFQLFQHRLGGHDTLQLLLTTGFLGALTTFSTFAVEGVTLWQGGYAPLALLYVVVSNVLGLSAVWLGMQISN